MSRRTPACAELHDALLEAEREELNGRAETPLARHLRSCEACASDARRILTTHDRLLAALSSVAPVADVASAALSMSPPRWRQRGFATAGSLAAAAALVLFAVRERPVDPIARLEPLPAPLTIAAITPVVNVAEGHDVVVLQPTNRNITVVWYLNRE